jgi:hypothetical protein
VDEEVIEGPKDSGGLRKALGSGPAHSHFVASTSRPWAGSLVLLLELVATAVGPGTDGCTDREAAVA